MKLIQKLVLATISVGFAACSRVGVAPEEPITPVVLPPVTTTPTEPVYPIPTTPMPGTGAMTHVVQAGEGLYGIARRYGVDFRDIAAWNNIPPPYTIHPGQTLRVSGSGGGAAPVGGMPPAPMPSTGGGYGGAAYHTVQRGDTLYSIGRRYGVHPNDLAAWNNLPPPYTLSLGQQVVVSGGGGGYAPQPTYTPPPTSTYPGGYVSQPTVVPYQPQPSAGGTYHTVQRGETLYSISKRYGYHYQDVAAWNGIAPPYSLRVGQSLKVRP